MTDNPKAVPIMLDQAEMAVRLYEALTGVRRKQGHTATQIMNDAPGEVAQGLARAAAAMAYYFHECMQAMDSTATIKEVVPESTVRH